MSLTFNLIINAYSILILMVIFLHSLNSTEKNLLHHKLFMAIVLGTALMLAVDLLSRLDGRPGTIYAAANSVGNFIIFLLNPLLPSLWLLYVCSQFSGCELKMIYWQRFSTLLNTVNITMLILTQFFGWYYTINADNVYQRGPLFWFPVTVTAVLLVSAYSLIIRHRKDVEYKRFLWLLLFPIPTIAASVLQIVFYGISLSFAGATLSILIAFLTLQSDRLSTDFLTGAYNRKGLETYLRQKINESSQIRTFSGILLDLNSFKSVNDTFGHNTGDSVLIAAVKLLKSCLQPKDFVARFGGDEFFIVLDISDPAELASAAQRIQCCFRQHQEPAIAPLNLDVSMGYAVYDYSRHQTAEEFQRQLDAVMYQNKRANKAPEPIRPITPPELYPHPAGIR